MPQSELLVKVIRALEAADLDYMATGSIVSSLQGEPRSTHDLDLVVALPRAAAGHLLRSFPAPDYYLDEEAVFAAIDKQSTFNLIDTREGDKVDFWLLTGEPFDRSRFARKESVDFLGVKLEISAPEDTILAKLRWAKQAGGSAKHRLDALRVFEVQRERMDLDYLRSWAENLGVREDLARLEAEAEAEM